METKEKIDNNGSGYQVKSIILVESNQHIANLAMKAGLGPIMLPPVNFQKLNKKKQ